MWYTDFHTLGLTSVNLVDRPRYTPKLLRGQSRATGNRIQRVAARKKVSPVLFH